ncbi:hypothetical protein [Shewanella sp.]|uniref:hypothetical protein n=1 Tax=Shewanella sp. TaxID=50422 RepID=UPI00404843EB
MERKTLNNFAKAITEINPEKPWDEKLKIYSDARLAVHYAPFEHINKQAKVVICGITPGKTQASEALKIAKEGLSAGLDLALIQEQAKQAASFKGLRDDLSSMLDRTGLNKKLGIETCNELFGNKSNLVHYTSAIRYPVILANGEGYNGTPKVNKTEILKKMLETYLMDEIQELGEDCIWVPLGKGAVQALDYLVQRGHMDSKQVISGLPNPSRENAESVRLFLEDIYPQLNEYQERKYQKYLLEGSWKKNGRKPQSEEQYKKIRKARWESVLKTRREYGIDMH